MRGCPPLHGGPPSQGRGLRRGARRARGSCRRTSGCPRGPAARTRSRRRSVLFSSRVISAPAATARSCTALRVGGDDVEAGRAGLLAHRPGLVAAAHHATALGPVRAGVLDDVGVVRVVVHRGRLEPERDQEVDHRARVAGLEGAPDGGGRCPVVAVSVIAHGSQSGRLRCPPSWMFRRSSASHCVGLQPAICRNSRVRWALVGVARPPRRSARACGPRRPAARPRRRSGTGGTAAWATDRSRPSSARAAVAGSAARRGRGPRPGTCRRSPGPPARPRPPRGARRYAAASAVRQRSHSCTTSSQPSGSVREPTRSCSSRRGPAEHLVAVVARPEQLGGRGSPAVPARRAGAPRAALRAARRAARPGPRPGAGPPPSRRTPWRRPGRSGLRSSTVPDTRTGSSTETMKVIHGDGSPRWLTLGHPAGLVGAGRHDRAGQHAVTVPEVRDRRHGSRSRPRKSAAPRGRGCGRPSSDRRSPVPPQRPAMISAAMLTAVSSGVRAPRSSPIGLDSRASSSSVTPASRRRSSRSSWVRREPIAPT